MKSKLLLIGLILLGYGFYTTMKPNLRQLANRNVLMITNEAGTGGGTAFYVKAPSGKTYVMTNNHICVYAEKNKLILHSYSGKQYPVKVIKTDEAKDLCIIETDSKQGLYLASSSSLYQKYHLFGNPKLYRWVHEEGEFFDATNVQLVHHVITDESPACDKSYMRKQEIDLLFFKMNVCMTVHPSMLSNIKAFPGNSGSPVLNEQGEIVGVLFAGDNTTQYGFIIPLSTVKEFLKGL